MKPSMSRFISVLLALVIPMVVAKFMFSYYLEGENKKEVSTTDKFDRETWLANEYDYTFESPRKKMIPDLERNYFLKEITANEFRYTLGDPAEEYEGEDEGEFCFAYGVGKWVEDQMGQGTLELCFDKRKHLKSHRVFQE